MVPGESRGAISVNSAAQGVVLLDGEALRRVHAHDGLERLQRVVPRAVGLALIVRVVKGEQARTVALRGQVERRLEGVPELIRVHRLGDGLDGHPAGRRSGGRRWTATASRRSSASAGRMRLRRRRRCGTRSRGRRCTGRGTSSNVASNPAVCCSDPSTASAFGSVAPSRTAARTVSGNSVAQVAAELGPVAESEEADLVLAERSANRVHVARRVVRADVLDDRRRCARCTARRSPRPGR